MAYHDLTKTIKTPENIEELLGLGLKFCIQSRRPEEISLTEGMSRMRRDIRLNYIFSENNEDLTETEYNYNPKLYIKSKRAPPLADDNTEARMTEFHSALESSRTFLQQRTKPATNITPTVESLLLSVMGDKRLVILLTDKNPGQAVMERHLYIKTMLREHMMDSKTYRQLDSKEANNIRKKFREDIWSILKNYEGDLFFQEMIFFQTGFREEDQMSQVYGMPNVHKLKGNRDRDIPFRPVISQCGSFSSIVSRYIDYYLQILVKLVPIYVKNSAAVLKHLLKLQMSNSYILFTSDAKSMYTNIDPGEGLQTIKSYIAKYANKLQEGFLKGLILELLEQLMTINVFKFGEFVWHQLIGTSIGTPCACAYATIFFAYFGRTNLIPRFEKHLSFYVRFIDDIFGV